MDWIKKNALYLLTALVLVIVIGGAIWEGTETMRWKPPQSPVVESFIRAIAEIPQDVGNWTGDTETERQGIENPLIQQESGAEGALARLYRSTEEPRAVEINIICGYARKLSIHTPTRCYVGSGYEILGDVEIVEIPYTARVRNEDGSTEKVERTARFKTAVFFKSTPQGFDRCRVFWGWKTTEPGWQAPMFPRFTWRSATPMCKLYLSVVDVEGDKLEENVVFAFGKAFFPQMDLLLTGDFDPEKFSDLDLVLRDEEEEADAEEQLPAAEDIVLPGL